jgi:hypothetical protein
MTDTHKISRILMNFFCDEGSTVYGKALLMLLTFISVLTVLINFGEIDNN